MEDYLTVGLFEISIDSDGDLTIESRDLVTYLDKEEQKQLMEMIKRNLEKVD